MATSGSFTTSAYNSKKWLVFSWSRSNYSITENWTDIYWELRGGGNTTSYHKAGAFKVVIDGEQVYYSATRIELYVDTLVASGTKRIWHNNDGTRSFSASAEGGIYTNAVNCTGSGSWTLDTIPRNSTISNVPTWTAPGSVTCNISRYATFTHTVCLDLKNSAGNWENVGTLNEQGTSATFSGETIMKRVFQVLNGRASCAARFTIYTNGPNGWTYGGEGTCTAAAANTVTAPTFTGTNSATTTITKGNSAFTTTVSVKVNGQTIGSASQTSDTTVTFNNTAALRKACITGLAQTASKTYTVTATTYYAGVQVRSATSKDGTCNAPSVDTVTTPNFTAGNEFKCTVTTASSELSRKLTFQIKNSGGTWVTIASQDATTTTSFTWANTEAQRDIVFTALGSAATRETRILTTTYYSGVQIRSADVSTGGTCTAPAASTCNAATWTAGSTFKCNVSRASSLLTHTITIQVKNSAGTLQTFQTVTKSSSTAIDFANTTELNTTLFNYLAQAATRGTKITITTYYKDIQIRSPLSAEGTLTAPDASTCSTTPNWTGGDSLSLTISRAHSSFTHTVVVKVNDQTITTLTGVGTSTSFGTSDSDRTKIYTALAQTASKASSVTVTTYYNGVQVRTAQTKTGTCSAPSAVTPTAPTWTAGNSFKSTITLSKSYLYYSIELKVGSTSVQSHTYQKDAKELTFADTVALNLKAYQGLNKNATATSQFVVKMYYQKADGTYLQAGPTTTTNGTCTALAANTITAPNWTAGSSFTGTITRKSVNLYSSVKLIVDGTTVQEYGVEEKTGTSYALTFANTKDINTKIYTALAQTASKTATFEITTYYGTSTTNLTQVRTPVQVTGTCTASEVATIKNLTLSQSPAIIDNTKATCTLNKPIADYTTKIEVRFNNVLIATLNPAGTSAEFNTASYINALYSAIPTQTTGSLQFKIITYYNGVQVQQPKTTAVDLVAKEATVKVKIDDSIAFSTTARVLNRTNTFIDNESMLSAKLSDLLVSITKGFFYMESKYGGYIKQIRAQIANSSSMLQLYNYTDANKIYNTEKTRIVNDNFTSDKAIVMGPYDFANITEAGTINNLVITATDSRGYTVSKTVPLKIFPYAAPTIKIDVKNSHRIQNNPRYLIMNLNGTISSLYKLDANGTKNQTNTIKRITLQYRVYGSGTAYSSYNIPTYTYNNTYTAWSITDFSTAISNPGIEFDIGNTFEVLVTVEDQYGKTNSDTIIILPDKPLLSFREERLGINTIPRKLGNITERNSESGEHPSLDVNGYIYSNGREVPTFSIVETWTV